MTTKALFVFAFFYLTHCTLRAQWIQRNNGVYGGYLSAIATNGSTVFAGTYYGGIYRSTNGGVSWAPANTGLTTADIFCIAINGSNVYVGTAVGVFVSTDSGSTWSPISTGLVGVNINCFAFSGSNIFVGTNKGVYLSTTNGASWSSVSTGLTDTYINTLAISGNNIFAGTLSAGVWLSTNNGASWTAVNSGLTNNNTHTVTLATSGSNIFLGTISGVFLSTNNGSSWTQINSGLIDPATQTSSGVGSFAVTANTIFASAGSGIYMTTNKGTTWTKVSSQTGVASLATDGTLIYAATRPDGVLISPDNGTSWKVYNTGLTATIINSIVINGNNLFAGAEEGGVFLSSNNGSSWLPANGGLTKPTISSMLVEGGNTFASTYGAGGIFFSDNGAASWKPTGLTSTTTASFTLNNSNILAGTFSGVFSSPDNGLTWTSASTGLPPNARVFSIKAKGSKLFAGVYDSNGGVYISTDNGATWTASNTGLTNTFIQSLVANETTLFVGTYGGGVFKSTDNGVSWVASNSGLIDYNVNALAIAGNNIFAATSSSGLFLSTNNGASWTSINTGLTFSKIKSLAINGTHIFAGTQGNGIWYRPLSDFSLSPSVTFNAPSSGNIGTTVTISIGGASLDPTPSNNVVSFNGVQAPVTSSTTNTITVNVPTGATSGSISVAFGGQTLTSTESFLVTLPQTINFAPPADVTIGDPSFVLLGSASSGLKVNYSTSTSNYLTLHGDTALLVAAGRASVTASQFGSPSYLAATPVKQSFCINPTKPSISITGDNTPTPTLTSNYASGNQWYLDDVAINGADSSSFVVSQPGVYKVRTTTPDGCVSSLSSGMSVVITGDILLPQAIVLYPNPSQDYIMVSGADEHRITSSSVIDIVGKSLPLKLEPQGNQLIGDIRNLTRGIYILRIAQDGQVRSMKFFKQ